MADTADLAQNAKQAILEQAASLAENVKSEAQARAVLSLAEAYAWIDRPDQPHGGGTTVKSG